MSELVKTAFEKLYPEEGYSFEGKIKYSGHFKGYNANVRKRGKELVFSLAKEWEEVDDEIKIGLIQDLLMRILKKKKESENVRMYNNFIKNLSSVHKETVSEPVLEGSFNRVNEKYFYGMMNKPHLAWGGENRRQWGTYHYSTDTIKLSSVLEQDKELLDYVMYHELLHKKLKYKDNKEKTMHHTKEFRTKEKEFENYPEMEQRLKNMSRVGVRRVRRWGWF